MRGEGALAQVIQDQFELYRRRFGLPEQAPELSIASFRRPVPVQQRLFDEK
jgi:hypothetical protein